MPGIDVPVILDIIPLKAKDVIRNHPQRKTSPGTLQAPLAWPV
jgi:hypothetical protein